MAKTTNGQKIDGVDRDASTRRTTCVICGIDVSELVIPYAGKYCEQCYYKKICNPKIGRLKAK